MQAVVQRTGGDRVSAASGGAKVMVLGRDRVIYAGLLGAPAVREFGCLTVYCALGDSIAIGSPDGACAPARLAVVQPYTRHRVSSPDRMIGVMMLEPESLDAARLPRFLSAGPAVAVPDSMAAPPLRAAFESLMRGDYGHALSSADIDLLFLGRILEGRRLDPRIAAIVDRIQREPHAQLPAEEGARIAGLSFSRFLHLFRAEVGTTFRGFRAWKRARSFLRYANGAPSLTDVALEIGYPDSTHFSHSIRQVYGLRPKDIFAGSRDLAIVCQDAVHVCAH